MEVNVKKCGVMHNRKRGVRRTAKVFEVNGKRIKVVEEFVPWLPWLCDDRADGKQEDSGGKDSSWVTGLE